MAKYYRHFIAHSLITASISLPLAGQSLVAHWNFDETVGTELRDVSGHANHGNLSNFDDVSSHRVSGKFGGAIQFDGIDDSITIPNINYGADGLFTIAFWYNCHSIDGERYRYLFSHGEDGAFERNSVYIYYTKSQLLRTKVIDANDDTGGANLNLTEIDQAPVDGQWHHYALVTSNGGSTVYIDGQNMGTMDHGGDPLTPNSDLMLGSRISRTDERFYDGKLDEFRIYDYALSETEVDALFSPQASAPISIRIELHPAEQGGDYWSVALDFDGDPNTQYAIEFSSDMDNWENHPISPVTPIEGPHLVRQLSDISSLKKEFYRIYPTLP